MRDRHRPPVRIDRVLDHPGVVRGLLEATAPHYPVQRYFRSGAEYRAQSGTGAMIVAPNFRADWVTAEHRVPEALPLLENPRLREAAAVLFGSEVEHVVPWGVYANVTWQLPFDQGRGHTDVPAFLGVDRTRYPTWFLSAMGHSGLFEAERVDIATAVSWYYRGSDGGFTYWADGPHAAPTVHEGAIFNTGIMGVNDRMFHRVRPVGERARGLLGGMTLDTRLEHDGGGRWAIRQDGRTRAEMDADALRTSVSWKAYVYRDAGQRRRHETGAGGLSLDAVLERFRADLAARGETASLPADPLHDEGFVELLARTYVEAPTVFGA